MFSWTLHCFLGHMCVLFIVRPVQQQGMSIPVFPWTYVCVVYCQASAATRNVHSCVSLDIRVCCLLLGQCSNKECPFLHIDPEKKMRDCPWYDRGFCRHGQYQWVSRLHASFYANLHLLQLPPAGFPLSQKSL